MQYADVVDCGRVRTASLLVWMPMSQIDGALVSTRERDALGTGLTVSMGVCVVWYENKTYTRRRELYWLENG